MDSRGYDGGMPKTRASLEANAVRLLRSIRALDPDERERRTMLIRDLAETLVDLREHFLTDDGRPDWTGRTWAARQAVRDLYAEANIPPDMATSLQATTRYHIGNILRERLSPEELEELGLGPSPRDRTRASYAERSALVREARGDSDDPDVRRTVGAALALLTRIPDERVAALRGRDRASVRAALARVAGRAEHLRSL